MTHEPLSQTFCHYLLTFGGICSSRKHFRSVAANQCCRILRNHWSRRGIIVTRKWRKQRACPPLSSPRSIICIVPLKYFKVASVVKKNFSQKKVHFNLRSQLLSGQVINTCSLFQRRPEGFLAHYLIWTSDFCDPPLSAAGLVLLKRPNIDSSFFLLRFFELILFLRLELRVNTWIFYHILLDVMFLKDRWLFSLFLSLHAERIPAAAADDSWFVRTAAVWHVLLDFSLFKVSSEAVQTFASEVTGMFRWFPYIAPRCESWQIVPDWAVNLPNLLFCPVAFFELLRIIHVFVINYVRMKVQTWPYKWRRRTWTRHRDVSSVFDDETWLCTFKKGCCNLTTKFIYSPLNLYIVQYVY